MTFFEIARVVKSRGLSGEVKVKLITDFPERLKSRKNLFIGKTPTEVEPITVLSVSVAPTFAIYRFEGIFTQDDALRLVGKSLFIEEKDLWKLEGDVAYIHELIGLKVVSLQGEVLGSVSDVLKLPASDVYEVKMIEGKSILIPAIAEFIQEVNLKDGVVTVNRFEEFL